MKTQSIILGMTLALPVFAQVQAQRPAPGASETVAATTKLTPATNLTRPRTNSAATRATTSLRAGGDGTRGGGETVNVRGIPELRDLVEKSVCDWRPGEEVIQTASYLPRILQNIARFDWYLARAIEEEIYRLAYCLTGPLVRVRTEDAESLTAVVTEGASQVAIRLADAVYMDTTITDRMNGRSYGYLLVHEALHSFLKMDEEERNHKLRSMVNSIQGIEQGRITTRQAFQLQVRRNSIVFPTMTVALDNARSGVEFALYSYEGRAELLRTQRLETLLSQLATVDVASLWEPHRDLVRGVTLTSVVQEILFFDDATTLEAVVKNSPTLSRNVVGLTHVHLNETESPAVARWLENQVSMVELAGDTLRVLAARTASLNDGKIMVAGQELLASDGRASTPASSLAALASSPSAHASAELQIYFSLLSKSLENGDLETARALSVANPLFYRAFGIKEVSAQVAALPSLSLQEKELALKNVRIMSIAAWAYGQNAVLSPLARDAWRELKSEINTTQLGFNL